MLGKYVFSSIMASTFTADKILNDRSRCCVDSSLKSKNSKFNHSKQELKVSSSLEGTCLATKKEKRDQTHQKFHPRYDFYFEI